MQCLQWILHLSCRAQSPPGYNFLVCEMKCFLQQQNAPVSEDELRLLIEEKDSRNTKRPTKSSAKVLIDNILRYNNLEKLHDHFGKCPQKVLRQSKKK